MNSKLLMAGLLGILTGVRAGAQPPAKDIEALLRRHTDGLPSGVLVALADMKSEPRLIAAGQRSAEDARPLAADTVFEIGSVTKVFTGLLLAQAVVEGRASLDDPIARHLPGALNLRGEVAAITLGQLASHTSGLPRLPLDFTPASMADPYAD